ncbi:MAG: SDR family NAD(P)-dependent oxidoreductase [Bdellovibrionales bacterium]|nr:SDR family NAD(P)-dependent oxidoreductase [Bdellovibrionales bacterium]
MKIALLGASRGLGFDVAKLALKKNELFIAARKVELLDSLPLEEDEVIELLACDFSKPENLIELIDKLKQFQPERIWYFAGGGPYGEFASKNWQDHMWAWQVTFLSPAHLIFEFLKNEFKNCQQFIVVGSEVAEDKPDPKAASYCSAKHALKGLLTSLQLEAPSVDLRLFSPGYMDTDLLPPNAYPRQQNLLILSPDRVAEDFWRWAFNPQAERHFYY